MAKILPHRPSARLIRTNYYMANPVLGKSLCSDWFFLGQDFAVWTVSMETVQPVYFCFGAKPVNLKFATKTAKETCEYCHSSQLNYQKKLKWLKSQKDKHVKDKKLKRFIAPEVHFTIRNRVPYNKQLTNWACLGRTGEYWPEVVAVRTERSGKELGPWRLTVRTSNSVGIEVCSIIFRNTAESKEMNCSLIKSVSQGCLACCKSTQYIYIQVNVTNRRLEIWRNANKQFFNKKIEKENI